MEILKVKRTITEIKKCTKGLNNRFELAEEKVKLKIH